MPDIVRFGRAWEQPGRVDETRMAASADAVCAQRHRRSAVGERRAAGCLAYILQQLEDFRHGLRLTADPKKENGYRMASFTKMMTPEETRAARSIFVAAVP
jgi:hypothetical protein